MENKTTKAYNNSAAAHLIFELSTCEHVTHCLLVALATGTLAHPLHTVLHYAHCLLRDLSSVSVKHCPVHWCLLDTFGPSVGVVNGLHTAAHKPRWTCVLTRRSPNIGCTAWVSVRCSRFTRFVSFQGANITQETKVLHRELLLPM